MVMRELMNVLCDDLRKKGVPNIIILGIIESLDEGEGKYV